MSGESPVNHQEIINEEYKNLLQEEFSKTVSKEQFYERIQKALDKYLQVSDKGNPLLSPPLQASVRRQVSVCKCDDPGSEGKPTVYVETPGLETETKRIGYWIVLDD